LWKTANKFRGVFIFLRLEAKKSESLLPENMQGICGKEKFRMGGGYLFFLAERGRGAGMVGPLGWRVDASLVGMARISGKKNARDAGRWARFSG